MDIHTGEVLAMTSLPQLNPNAAGQGSPEARFNRATLGVYELGLDLQAVHRRDGDGQRDHQELRQDVPVPARASASTARSIHDTHPYGRACSVAEIMKESSNIGTAQIAAAAGCDAAAGIPRQDGLPRAESRSSFEERGRTLTPGSNWGPFETMTVGFGHGIAVTPAPSRDAAMRPCSTAASIARATLLKVDRDHAAGKGHRVFTEETSYKMRALLRLVVTKGTGKKADAPGYRVGGKTGHGREARRRTLHAVRVVTSFAGVFPMDEPRYVMVMMLDEPKATAETYGFRTAGVERRSGVRRDRQPDRADARRASRQEPRARHVDCASLRSRRREALKR